MPASDGVVAGDERATSDGGRTACGTSAGSGACLCDAVKRCQPAQGGSTFGLGSESLRVCGRDGDRCTVTAFREIEGGGTAYVCHVPIGEPACDSSINYGSVSKWCEQRSQCNLLMQSCPADVLACP